MKKIILFLIASFMLMSLAACQPQESQDSQDSTLSREDSESSQEESEESRPVWYDDWQHKENSDYYVFAYTEDMDSYYKEVIGNRVEGCKLGSFYSLKTTGKVPTLLYDKSVSDWDQCENVIYFVTAENQLMVTDYEGTQVRELYQATHGDIRRMWHHRQAMFLLEGETVVRIDLEKETSEVIAECPGILRFFVLSSDYFLGEKENKERILHQISTKTDRLITDYDEWASFTW